MIVFNCMKRGIPSSVADDGRGFRGGNDTGTAGSVGGVDDEVVSAGCTEVTKMAAVTDTRLPATRRTFNIRFILLSDDISPDGESLAPFC
jgi:hypothetical protein